MCGWNWYNKKRNSAVYNKCKISPYTVIFKAVEICRNSTVLPHYFLKMNIKNDSERKKLQPVLILFCFLRLLLKIIFKKYYIIFCFCSFWHFWNNLRKITQNQNIIKHLKIKHFKKHNPKQKTVFIFDIFKNSF